MSEELTPPLPKHPEEIREENVHALKKLNKLLSRTPDAQVPAVLSSIFETPLT